MSNKWRNKWNRSLASFRNIFALILSLWSEKCRHKFSSESTDESEIQISRSHLIVNKANENQMKVSLIGRIDRKHFRRPHWQFIYCKIKASLSLWIVKISKENDYDELLDSLQCKVQAILSFWQVFQKVRDTIFWQSDFTWNARHLISLDPWNILSKVFSFFNLENMKFLPNRFYVKSSF